MAVKKKKNKPSEKPLIQKIRKNLSSAIIVLLVVFLGVVLLINFLGARKIKIKQKAQNVKKIVSEILAQSGDYKVKEGDNLWTIAEIKYGSGYNFVDIVSANKIANPDFIMPGQVFKLPDVKKRAPTVGEVTTTQTSSVTIKDDNYKVQKGDYLWKIAVAAYGDGYQWPKIAATNKIPNPDIIYPDLVLKLPR